GHSPASASARTSCFEAGRRGTENRRLASIKSLTGREVFDLVRSDLQKVEEELCQQIASSVSPVTEIGQYLQVSGGKRLRPALVLLASKMCGYEGPSAIKLGAVVELIHTATLVHDDVIDEAASLFSACLRLGAILDRKSDEDEMKLAAYGTHLGLAFQLVDDILDFTASQEKLGKPIGNDVREGKVTLPLIYMLRPGGPEES